MTFSVSPMEVHCPSPAGKANAETSSPNVSSISMEEPVWWIVMAVLPALKLEMISSNPSDIAVGGTYPLLYRSMKSCIPATDSAVGHIVKAAPASVDAASPRLLSLRLNRACRIRIHRSVRRRSYPWYTSRTPQGTLRRLSEPRCLRCSK